MGVIQCRNPFLVQVFGFRGRLFVFENGILSAGFREPLSVFFSISVFTSFPASFIQHNCLYLNAFLNCREPLDGCFSMYRKINGLGVRPFSG